jgi:hypothetical protein
LAKIGFYGFLAGFILWLVLSLLLLQKISGIKDFAISVTPKVLTSDLKALKDYSTPDLAKVVEYDSEFSAYKEKIKGVGAIKNCAVSDGDSIEVAFVPVTNSDGTSYRYTASYSVRCYGENKMIAVGIVLVNKEKQWQISDFAFNANITKDTDVEALETDSED